VPKALHAVNNPSLAPKAQWLSAPRFSVGLATTTIQSPIGTAFILCAPLMFYEEDEKTQPRMNSRNGQATTLSPYKAEVFLDWNRSASKQLRLLKAAILSKDRNESLHY
jgi:hypothetical protein